MNQTVQSTIDNLLSRCKQVFASARLSLTSRKLYLADIRKYLVSISREEDLTVSTLSDTSLYQRYLSQMQTNCSPASVRRAQAALRQLGKVIAATYGVTDPTSRLEVVHNSVDYIRYFTNHLNASHLSEITIKSYKSDINQYLRWGAKQGFSTDMVRVLAPKNIKNYLEHLTKVVNVAESTIERKKASIARFTEWYHNSYPSLTISDNKSSQKPLDPDPIPHIQKIDDRPYPTRGNSPLPKYVSKLPAYSPKLISFFIFILLFTGITYFGYRQLASERVRLTQAVFPSTPTTPNRQLSFQGRLENSSGTPVTTATDMVFKLFTASSGGSELYSTGTCSIDPDTDGVFSTQIGSTCGPGIGSTVFTENANVWLEVTVDSETMDPRQQIATVAYALNTETLQGFPISATVSAVRNTVVPMNQWGEIIVGEQSPRLTAVAGTFQISAPSLSLVTATGTNGNITLAPDGTGQVNINGNTTSTSFFNVSNAQLTTGSLITATAANDNTGFKLLDLLSGSSPTSKFSVSDTGLTTVGADLYVSSGISLYNNAISDGGVEAAKFCTGDGETNCITDFAALLAGSSKWTDAGNYLHPITGEWLGNEVSGGTNKIAGLYLADSAPLTFGTDNDVSFSFSGTVLGVTQGNNDVNFDGNTLFIDGTDSRIGIGTNAPSGKLDIFTGTTGNDLNMIFQEKSSNVQEILFKELDNPGFALRHNGSSTFPNNLFQIAYNSTNNGSDIMDAIAFTVNQLGNIGIGTTTPTAKLDIAGSASSSATLAFRGTTDPKIDILNGENLGIRTSVGGDTGLAERLTIRNDGNVGIGTTNPTMKFVVTGTDTSLSGYPYLSQFNYTHNPASDSTATTYALSTAMTGAGSSLIGSIGTFLNQTTNNNTSTVTNATALNNQVVNSSTGTITNATGESVSISNSGGGSIGTAMGLSSYITAATGTISNARSISVGIPSISGSGSITDARGIYIYGSTPAGTGAVGTQYGINIGNIIGATSNNYSIYTNSGIVRFGDDLYLASGLSTFGTAVSDGTIEATKFCTGDGETNCVTDFSALSSGASIWTDGGSYIRPTNSEWLGNEVSGGANKITGLYLADSAPLTFGTDNDVSFSFSGTVLGVTQGDNDINFDSNTLFIDGSTNYVGIGTNAPIRPLHLAHPSPELILEETDQAVDSKIWRQIVTNGAYYFQALNDAITSSVTPLIITRTGNISIGSSLPTAKLDIAGSASSSGTLAFRGTTDPKIDILNGENLGIRTSVGGDTGLSERFTILNNGFIGINDTTPSYLLDIAQTTADSVATRISVNDAGTTLTANSPVLYLQNTNSANNNFANLYFGDGNGGASAVIGAKITDHTNNYGELHFYTGGSGGADTRMIIDSAGMVGIGSTAPSAALDVTGDIYISNGLSLFETAVSDGTVEATKFCTGDGETNCVTDFAGLTAGANIWANSGTTDYLATTTNDVVIGGNTPLSSAKFSIDGDADQIQQVVQAVNGQTANVAEWQWNGGSVMASINSSGVGYFNGGLGVGGAAGTKRFYSVIANKEPEANYFANHFTSSFLATADSSHYVTGVVNAASVAATNTNDFGGLTGADFSAANYSSVGDIVLNGGTFRAVIGDTIAATSSTVRANELRVDAEDATVTTLQALHIDQLDVDTGAVTSAFGIDMDAPVKGTGSINTLYGIRLGNINVGNTNYAILTNAGNIVFNEGGDTNTDLRVEGVTDANLLFTDASADKVGIGLNNPAYKLDVVQSITDTSNVQVLQAVGRANHAAGTMTAAYGLNYLITKGGAGDITESTGITGTGIRAYSGAGGTVATAIGARIKSAQLDSGSSTNITNAKAIEITSSTNSGTGSIANNYGIYLNNQTAATSSNYGAYIGNISGATTNYAIYTNSGINRFGDDVYLASGLSTFGTAVSDGTIEATKFCTGDGETNCVTDFSALSSGASIWTDGGNYIRPTNSEWLGNEVSGGANKIAGLYLADSAPLTFGTDNDVSFNFSGTVLGVTQGDNDVNFDANTLFVDGSANRIGIGTATPGTTLDVNGNMYVGNIYVGQGTNAQITTFNTNESLQIDPAGTGNLVLLPSDNNGNIGIGTNSPTSKLDILGNLNQIGSATHSASYAEGIPITIKGFAGQTANLTEWQNSSGSVLGSISGIGHFGLGTTPSSSNRIKSLLSITDPSSSVGGISSSTYITATSGDDTYQNTGINSSLYVQGVANHTNPQIGFGSATYNNGTGNASNIEGFRSTVGTLSTGTITNAYGGRMFVYSPGAGAITNLFGLDLNYSDDTVTGNMIGLQIASNTVANGTNKYGLSIGSVSGASTANYAIYTNAGINRFGDDVYLASGLSTFGTAVSDGTIEATKFCTGDGETNCVTDFAGLTAGANIWANSGTTDYLATTTNDVVIGGNTPLSSAKFSIDGDADQIQSVIQGTAGQTANLTEWQNSSGTILTAINGTGRLIADLGTVSTNFFIGPGAGNTSATGGVNMAIGRNAGDALTSGQYNLIIGDQAGSAIQDGTNNTFIGRNSGMLNVSAEYNTGIGGGTLQNATTSYNVAIGANALQDMTTGVRNMAIGYAALGNLVDGDYNVAIGMQTGRNASGDKNTLIGYNAGYDLSSGSSNILIGHQAGTKITTESGILLIDNVIRADAATETTNAIIYGVMAASPTSQTLSLNALTTISQDLYLSSGLSTFGTAVSDGTIEATKFCTGDGETNCVTDFSAISGGGLWTDGTTYIYPTGGKVLGNAASAGANKIEGLYLADSAPLTFGTDNDFSFSFNNASSTLGSSLTAGTRMGINTTSALATLDIRSSLGTIPVASVSGNTSMAALVVDQSGSGDVFTASSSGETRFVVKSNGNVGVGVSNPTSKFQVGGTSSTISNSSGDLNIDSASGSIVFGTDDDLVPTLGAGDATLGTALSPWDALYTTLLSANRYEDSANTAYYLDPAATTTSLNVAGDIYMAAAYFGLGTTYYVDDSGNAKFNNLIVADTANPGLTVGDGTTGYIKVGGSTIFDAAGNLTLDSDSNALTLAATDTTLTATGLATLDTAATVSWDLTTLNAAGLATLDTAASFSWDATALTLGGSAVINGGTAASGTLTLVSTTHGTKGAIQFFTGSNTIDSSGNLIIAGTARVNGNSILSSAGTEAISMSNDDVSVVGCLNVGSATECTTQGYATAARFVDSASSTNYLDPAATATSLAIAGDILNTDTTAVFSIASSNNQNIVLNAGSGTVVIGDGTGKLDAGTVDPPYTINGEKFATYMAGMTGVKEETTGFVETKELVNGIGYRTAINFSSAEKNSDLWLFSKVANLRDNMKSMVVLLSPMGNTKAWYQIHPESGILEIYSSTPTVVSYRLTAPRFDHTDWSNTRHEGSDGFVLDSPDNWGDSGSPIALAPEFDIRQDIELASGSSESYSLVDSAGTLVHEMVSASRAFIANLRVGMTETNELKTDLISPLSEGGAITVDGPVTVASSGSEVPALTVEGEIDAATISARVAQLDEIRTNKLYADEIVADKITANSIEGLDARIASLSAGQTTSLTDSELESITDRIKSRIASLTGNVPKADDLPAPAESTGSAVLALDPVSQPEAISAIASDSATLASLDADFVTINNYLAVIGHATMTSLEVTTDLYTDSITSKVGTLALQPLGGSVNLAANTLIVDSTGQVAVNGDLTISGRLMAASAEINSLSLGTPPSASNSATTALGALLAVYDEHGTAVATIDASGSADFAGVTTKLVTIAAASEASKSGELSTSTGTNATAGESVLTAGETDLTIQSPYVNSNSLVYLTPTTNTDNKVLFVKSKVSCQTNDTSCNPSFTVGIDTPSGSDISFNWWIIELEKTNE